MKLQKFTLHLSAQIFPDQMSVAEAFFISLEPQTSVELYEREWQGSVCQYLHRLGYEGKYRILRLFLMEDKRIRTANYYEVKKTRKERENVFEGEKVLCLRRVSCRQGV